MSAYDRGRDRPPTFARHDKSRRVEVTFWTQTDLYAVSIASATRAVLYDVQGDYIGEIPVLGASVQDAEVPPTRQVGVQRFDFSGDAGEHGPRD